MLHLRPYTLRKGGNRAHLRRIAIGGFWRSGKDKIDLDSRPAETRSRRKTGRPTESPPGKGATDDDAGEEEAAGDLNDGIPAVVEKQENSESDRSRRREEN